MPNKLDALVQQFGCAGHDPLIQAMAILLVEKTYFSKPELERWASRFEDTPSTIPAKWVSPNDMIISPRKRNILSRRENINTMDEQIEGMLNAKVSVEEQRAWDMIIDLDHVEVFAPHTLHTQHDKNVGGEAGDDGSASENERSDEEDEDSRSHRFAATSAPKPQGTKAQGGLTEKKPS